MLWNHLEGRIYLINFWLSKSEFLWIHEFSESCSLIQSNQVTDLELIVDKCRCVTDQFMCWCVNLPTPQRPWPPDTAFLQSLSSTVTVQAGARINVRRCWIRRWRTAWLSLTRRSSNPWPSRLSAAAGETSALNTKINQSNSLLYCSIKISLISNPCIYFLFFWSCNV